MPTDSIFSSALTGTALDPCDLEVYRRKLHYKVSHHLGSSCPDIEDLVQETMARFLRALQTERFRNPESMAAFLSGICNNVIHEYKRQSTKDGVREPVSEQDEPSVPPSGELTVLREAIGMAMAQLSARDREILRKFYLEEKERGEICRDLDMSEVQFRVNLFRARQRFKEIYESLVKQNASK